MAGELGATTDRLLNRLQYAAANKAATGTTLATGDLILTADVSADYKVVAATPGEIVAGFGVTASAAQINAAATPASRIVTLTDATPYTVLAANSGKIHVLPDFTSTTTLNLPAVAAGLEYTFIGKAVAAEAQNWVFTAAASAYLLGGVAFADNDAGAGADEIHVGLYPNGSSHLTLTVVTPAAGTYIYMICDGTNWIVNGWVNSATVPAFS